MWKDPIRQGAMLQLNGRGDEIDNGRADWTVAGGRSRWSGVNIRRIRCQARGVERGKQATSLDGPWARPYRDPARGGRCALRSRRETPAGSVERLTSGLVVIAFRLPFLSVPAALPTAYDDCAESLTLSGRWEESVSAVALQMQLTLMIASRDRCQCFHARVLECDRWRFYREEQR